MQLTLFTDYALRVLIQVGLNDGKLTTINDNRAEFRYLEVVYAAECDALFTPVIACAG